MIISAQRKKYLDFVNANSGVDMKQIVEHFGVDEDTSVAAIAWLVKERLIEKIRTERSDGRVRYHKLDTMRQVVLTKLWTPAGLQELAA